MFARIDTDQDGQASFEDLLENLAAVLQFADSLAAGDDAASAASEEEDDGELMASEAPAVSESQSKRIRAIFDGCDTNGNGTLSGAEVEELLFRLDVAPIRGRRGKALRRRESVCGLLNNLERESDINYAQFESLMIKALSKRSAGSTSAILLSRNSASALSLGNTTPIGRKPGRASSDVLATPAPQTPGGNVFNFGIPHSNDEAEEQIAALQTGLAEYEAEITHLRSTVKQLTKDQQHFHDAAQDQLDQAEATMDIGKRAAAARLKSELNVLRLQKDDEISAWKLKAESSGQDPNKDNAATADLIKTIREERAQLAFEVDGLTAQIAELNSKAEETERQSEQDIVLLTEDLEEHRDALQRLEIQNETGIVQLEEAKEHIQRLQDINDELRMPKVESRPGSRVFSDDMLPHAQQTPKLSLSDELGNSASAASEGSELERAYKRISRVESEKKMLVREMAEFSQINTDLRAIAAMQQKVRDEAHNFAVENETLKYMYKELRANSTNKADHKKLQARYAQLNSIYQGVKVYAAEIEQSKRLQDLHINTLELELAAARDESLAPGRESSSPVPCTPAKMSPPSTPRTSNRTIQTLMEVQEARMSESEAGKDMVEWRLKKAKTELKRKTEEIEHLKSRAKDAESAAQDALSKLAILSGLTTADADADPVEMEQQPPMFNLGPSLQSEKTKELETIELELREQNAQLTAKVDRLQTRLQQHDRYTKSGPTSPMPPPSPMPQAPIDELDRLIADFETSKSSGVRSRRRADNPSGRATRSLQVPSTSKGDDTSKPRTSKKEYSRNLMTKVMGQIANSLTNQPAPKRGINDAVSTTPANESRGK
jgi:hypothetical protein